MPTVPANILARPGRGTIPLDGRTFLLALVALNTVARRG